MARMGGDGVSKYECKTCMDLKNDYMRININYRISGCPDCGDYSIRMEVTA